MGWAGRRGAGLSMFHGFTEMDFVRAVELVDCAGRVYGSGESGCAESAAEQGVYAGAAGGVGDGIWTAGDGVEGGGGDVGDADGVGVGAEEPEGGSGEVAGGWV